MSNTKQTEINDQADTQNAQVWWKQKKNVTAFACSEFLGACYDVGEAFFKSRPSAPYIMAFTSIGLSFAVGWASKEYYDDTYLNRFCACFRF